MKRHKKVILTGFFPFGDYKFNPTEEIVKYFNNKTITGHEHIYGIVLPCTYYGASEILSDFIDKINPNGIISLGLSSSVKSVRIETVFRNLMNGKYPDATGFMPEKLPLIREDDAREFLPSFADNIFLADLIHSNKIPVEISGDASAYICNSLGYLTSKKIIDEGLSIKNMFVHIPWTDDYTTRINLEPGKTFIGKDVVDSAIKLIVEHI